MAVEHPTEGLWFTVSISIGIWSVRFFWRDKKRPEKEEKKNNKLTKPRIPTQATLVWEGNALITAPSLQAPSWKKSGRMAQSGLLGLRKWQLNDLRGHCISKYVLAIQIWILTSAIHITSHNWFADWVIVGENGWNGITWKKKITARVKNMKGKSFLFKMIKFKISLGILNFQHATVV